MSEIEGPRRSRRLAARATAVEPVTAKAKVTKSPAKPKKAAPKQKEPKEETPEESAESKELEVGDEIPNVTLKNQAEEDVNVFELSKTKPVVLFAYPKASTPGCTRQAKSYRDEYEQFADATVFGISKDSPAAQLKFKEKNEMQFDLLSDSKFELLKALGGAAAGKVIRSQWVIKDGKVVSKTVKISPDKSVPNSLEALKE